MEKMNMNKGRRNELRDLKFKRRLKNLGLTSVNPKDYVCFRDQGKPCSCYMCSPKGEKNKYKLAYNELRGRRT